MRALVQAMREVAGECPSMASHLWVLVFPIVWAALSENKEQQVLLAKPIITLLSRQSNTSAALARWAAPWNRFVRLGL